MGNGTIDVLEIGWVLISTVLSGWPYLLLVAGLGLIIASTLKTDNPTLRMIGVILMGSGVGALATTLS